jgi:transcriptional regulator with XRE-family HTH domain
VLKSLKTVTCAKGTAIDAAIGRKLRLRRIVLGLSRAALARAVGIPASALAEYERGTSVMEPSVIALLCQEMSVSLQVVFDDIEPNDLRLPGRLLNRNRGGSGEGA